MAIFQDIRPRQSSLGVAAGKNRLQVHLQQEVHRGRLSDVASAQPGTLHASIHGKKEPLSGKSHHDTVFFCKDALLF